MKILGIKKAGSEPVYNMSVEKHNNFSVSGGLVVHNCDALRYFAVMRTYPPVPPLAKETRYSFDEDIDVKPSGGLYD